VIIAKVLISRAQINFPARAGANANVYRLATFGRAYSRDIDPYDPSPTQLHRGHLSHCHGDPGTRADVTRGIVGEAVIMNKSISMERRIPRC